MVFHGVSYLSAQFGNGLRFDLRNSLIRSRILRRLRYNISIRRFIPLEDVPAGPGPPFDSSPAITVERDVFPAGKGFDLAGDVDSCHSVHLWRTGRYNGR